ncbi:hypothetical protein GCM10009589_00770 [Arthrobacter pascens]
MSLPKPERHGRLARTYGGAMALGAHHPEASLRQRTGEAFEQKHAIARWAASVIQPGESILLDAGSTVGALAHELRGFEKLSVTTPGINTMQELADSEGIDVDCLGGRLRSLSQSFVGPLAEAALERMSFDRVFLGADAVTAEDGICEANHAQTVSRSSWRGGAARSTWWRIRPSSASGLSMRGRAWLCPGPCNGRRPGRGAGAEV